MKQTKHIQDQMQLAQFVINLSKWNFVEKPMTFTYEPYKEDKTRDQENMYHALIRDIAKHYQWEIAGKRRSMADWKQWLTAGYRKAKRESIDLVPFDEGLIMFGCHTSDFKRGEASDFITYLESLLAELAEDEQ